MRAAQLTTDTIHSSSQGTQRGERLPTTFENGARLPGTVVDALKPYFPEDFDHSTIRLNNGIPWWAAGDPDAVTFRNTIHLREGTYAPNTPGGIALIGHEVLHVQQFRELGIAGFIRRYFSEYTAGRLSGLGPYEAYRGISLESSAFDLQERIRADLLRRGP